MILMKPSLTLDLDKLTGQEILEKLERIGRLSHKSEGLIKPGTAAKFIGKWAIQHGHAASGEQVVIGQLRAGDVHAGAAAR